MLAGIAHFEFEVDTEDAAYIEADIDGDPVWGVGLHTSSVTASLRAVVNAVNRALPQRTAPDAPGPSH